MLEVGLPQCIPIFFLPSVDVLLWHGRKDNYLIRFDDGRERRCGEDKLTFISGGGVEDAMRGMAGMQFEQENMPPSGYGGSYGGSPEKSRIDYGNQQAQIHSQGVSAEKTKLRSVEGSGVGELQIGQKMLYRQTGRSEPEECTILSVELPSTNGHMRTKTFYEVQFSDGRKRG